VLLEDKDVPATVDPQPEDYWVVMATTGMLLHRQRGAQDWMGPLQVLEVANMSLISLDLRRQDREAQKNSPC
jgi:hypothetical protein